MCVLIILGFTAMAQNSDAEIAKLIRDWNNGPLAQEYGKVNTLDEYMNVYNKALKDVLKDVNQQVDKEYHTEKN